MEYDSSLDLMGVLLIARIVAREFSKASRPSNSVRRIPTSTVTMHVNLDLIQNSRVILS
jgi:hypothetical protein